jgi:hypothetical protein
MTPKEFLRAVAEDRRAREQTPRHPEPPDAFDLVGAEIDAHPIAAMRVARGCHGD